MSDKLHRQDRKPHFSKFSDDKQKREEKSKCGHSNNPFTNSNGEITIVVIRQSFNIKTNDLPYFLFGYLYLKGGINNAYNLLEPYLNGMLLDITIVNDVQVNFQYTEGLNVDTIQVFYPPVYSVSDYVTFVNSLATNYFTSNFMRVSYNMPLTDFVPLAAIAQLNVGNLYSLMGVPFIFYEIGSTSNVGGSKTADVIYPAGRLNSAQNIFRLTQFDMQYTFTTVDIPLNCKKISGQTAWIHLFKSGMKTGFGFLSDVEGVMVNTITIVLNERVDLNKRAEDVYIENNQ